MVQLVFLYDLIFDEDCCWLCEALESGKQLVIILLKCDNQSDSSATIHWFLVLILFLLANQQFKSYSKNYALYIYCFIPLKDLSNRINSSASTYVEVFDLSNHEN